MADTAPGFGEAASPSISAVDGPPAEPSEAELHEAKEAAAEYQRRHDAVDSALLRVVRQEGFLAQAQQVLIEAKRALAELVGSTNESEV